MFFAPEMYPRQVAALQKQEKPCAMSHSVDLINGGKMIMSNSMSAWDTLHHGDNLYTTNESWLTFSQRGGTLSLLLLTSTKLKTRQMLGLHFLYANCVTRRLFRPQTSASISSLTTLGKVSTRLPIYPKTSLSVWGAA